MRSNVADLLTAAAEAEGARTALSAAADGSSITWHDLNRLADGVAAGLSDVGLVAGYRVMIATTNRIEFVAAYFGVLRARMVAVPVNPRSTADEFARMLVDSGARLVFTDATTDQAVAAAIAEVSEPIRRINVEDGDWGTFTSAEHEPAPGASDAESLAVLLYTSGTSGRPRAAMLSHRSLLANVDQVAQVEPPIITPLDVVLGVLPMFHVYGLNAVLGQVVARRARLVLADGFDPEGSLDLIEDEAVSILPIAPPALAYWLQVEGAEDRFGPVRTVLSGSAPLSAELADAFTSTTGIEVQQGYGLTEAAPVVSWTLVSERPNSRSVGAPLPGVRLQILDESGSEVEIGEVGEISVNGPNLFSGYWPDGADGPDDAGWWRTGDLGYVDEAGNLFLVDRIKEIVIVSGFNVYPSEVEEVLREVPGVRGAAVVGEPDEETGEAVVAWVVGDDDGLVEEVRAHCEARLSPYKRPREINVVEALPTSIAGKVQKGRLRSSVRRTALGLID